MQPENYSIKEMISEFRKDVSDNFKDVNTHLQNIDTKQGVANGRTSKIEGKVKTIIVVATIGWTVSLGIGGLFARLYVADIARAALKESREDIIKDVNLETKKTVSEILNEYDSIIIKN